MFKFNRRAPDMRALARRGQILVVVAIAMLGLLITAGIATDVGILMMRKAQFDRAVDGAALAGAPVANEDLTMANDRGREILATNGIRVNSNSLAPCPLTGSEDYCGSEVPANLPGSTQYHVEARWTVPLAFMSLARFYNFTLTSSADAVYYDNVDIYVSNNDQGILSSASLELFGPNNCSSSGDAFSPTLWDNRGNILANRNPYIDWIDPPGVYTYRIAIPPDFEGDDERHLVRVELFDPQSANYAPTTNTPENMDLRTSGTGSTNYLPTSVQTLNNTFVTISGGKVCDSTSRTSPCLQGGEPGSPDSIDPNNSFWYVRMDENRGPCNAGIGNTYTPSVNTTTEYILYYYKEQASGQLIRTNLAKYTGKSDGVNATEAFATALQWIVPMVDNTSSRTVDGVKWPTPDGERMKAFTENEVGIATTLTANHVSSPKQPWIGADACPTPGTITCGRSNGDFVVNLDEDRVFGNQPPGEVEDIYEDPTTKVRYLYLDVRSTGGSSENNWGLWAGPSPIEDADAVAPSFVNARQVYILRNKVYNNVLKHTSRGIVAYGVGHMPMNSNTETRIRFPLATIGPELAGATMRIRLYDSDAGTDPPIAFYYDTIPQADWSQCWGDSFAQCRDVAGSPLTWQYVDVPDNFGDPCMAAHYSCGLWAEFEFVNPTDAEKGATNPPPIPFYGGRLMVNYQGGPQDSFGWWITVLARPALVN